MNDTNGVVGIHVSLRNLSNNFEQRYNRELNLYSSWKI